MVSRNTRQLDAVPVVEDSSSDRPGHPAPDPDVLYYFDLEAPLDTVGDAKGSRFASVEAARTEGLRRAKQLIAKMVRAGELDLRGVITIRNEALDVVDRIRLADAVKIQTS